MHGGVPRKHNTLFELANMELRDFNIGTHSAEGVKQVVSHSVTAKNC